MLQNWANDLIPGYEIGEKKWETDLSTAKKTNFLA